MASGYFGMGLFPLLLEDPVFFNSCIKHYLREGGEEILYFLLNIWHMLWVGATEQLTSHLYDQRDYSCKTFLILVIIHAHGRYLAELWLLSVLICKICIVKSVVWFKSSSWSDTLILWDCCMWESLSFGG